MSLSVRQLCASSTRGLLSARCTFNTTYHQQCSHSWHSHSHSHLHLHGSRFSLCDNVQSLFECFTEVRDHRLFLILIAATQQQCYYGDNNAAPHLPNPEGHVRARRNRKLHVCCFFDFFKSYRLFADRRRGTHSLCIKYKYGHGPLFRFVLKIGRHILDAVVIRNADFIVIPRI